MSAIENYMNIQGGNDGWSKPLTNEIGKTPGDACVSTCDSVDPTEGQAIVLVRIVDI